MVEGEGQKSALGVLDWLHLARFGGNQEKWTNTCDTRWDK